MQLSDLQTQHRPSFLPRKNPRCFVLVKQLDPLSIYHVETQPARLGAGGRQQVQYERRSVVRGSCRGHRARRWDDSSLGPLQVSLALGLQLQVLFSRLWKF